MDRIKVMVNGIPGNMAVNVARHVLADDRFELVPASLTGPEIEEKSIELGQTSVRLINPDAKEAEIENLKDKHGGFISVDYSHPTAVNQNAVFYCEHGLPFVMGTTGGDREQLSEIVATSNVPAVIAPNMAKQIVGMQAMMEYAADTFPGLFDGYSVRVRESHQKGKADTSGTAKAMIGYFNRLGVPCLEKNIEMERDPGNQKELGIPDEFICGHGWHTYTFISEDETVKFEFTHNVNGRDVYARGTLDAIVFLDAMIKRGEKSEAYNMIDVLKAGGMRK